MVRLFSSIMNSIPKKCDNDKDLIEPFVGQSYLDRYGDVVFDLRKEIIYGKAMLDNYSPSVKTILMTNRVVTDLLEEDIANDFVLDHVETKVTSSQDVETNKYYYLNKLATNSAQRPPHVCTNANGSLEIRGSAAFVVVRDDTYDIYGFIFVKDTTRSYLMMPAGGVDSDEEQNSDGGYRSAVTRELFEETGYLHTGLVKNIGGWNFIGNFCGEKHLNITQVFQCEIHPGVVASLLRYTSNEIEEVVFVSKDFLMNNLPVKNGDKITCPVITLRSGKQCEIGVHHVLPAYKLLGFEIDEYIPSYVTNYVIACL